MDHLTKINSLSIAELRKILKDNDVKETSCDKEGLISQATDILLTNMAIQDIMEYDTITPFEKTINENILPDPNTILREEQDREYEECLKIDNYINNDLNTDKISQESTTQTNLFEELSPKSLREKRLAFYQ